MSKSYSSALANQIVPVGYSTCSRSELMARGEVVTRDADGYISLTGHGSAIPGEIVAFDDLTNRERRSVHQILFGVD